MSETVSQEYRASSPSKVLSIPTRFDPNTKQFVARWKDFQHCFENVKRIMNEEAAILFVTDDDLQDSPPLRISPGVVFKVLVTNNDQGSSSLTGVPDPTPEYEASQSINVVGSYNTQSSSMITRDDINSIELVIKNYNINYCIK
ncbi:hypothetical protein BGZ65_004488 [Modicella reniformis]|uniref:Uncharacterized protein n=1 Tax=Modicella reniformis TaxID=1440133 RepID=A0A9P6LYB0_9FUNG|nr:hypothetical protein BGZ65_004488 [Modicella reniformis]